VVHRAGGGADPPATFHPQRFEFEHAVRCQVERVRGVRLPAQVEGACPACSHHGALERRGEGEAGAALLDSGGDERTAMKDACWMIPPTQAPCFIQLGRFGDLILLFPAFKAIYDRTGHKPIVMVSTEYASVFDGILYAKPFPVHWHWWQGIPEARRLAEEQFGGAIIPQWWHEPPKDNLLDQQQRGGTVLQCHGHEWGINVERWPNFMTSMWERAGFTAEEMRTLPLVFDLRDLGTRAPVAGIGA
jgi:hypothetical protein